MSLSENLTVRLAEWKSLQPLAEADEKRLWEKLRLEWNYHSNHLEGNTLTYGETELLLIHGTASGDHDYRDYLEMKAHDAAIVHLRQLVEEERPLTEGDIRDLNRILLKEPFRKEAITPDGLATTIEIVPGQYKEQSNNVRTKEGGVFEFAPPSEVSSRMNDLVNFIRAGFEEPETDLVALAAKVHHEFVLIHPFGDGNGRTARLLVNYLLLLRGWVPLIVPTEEKDRYLAALRKADAKEPDAFIDYLAECALTALERGIRAGKGESLEEPDDLTKEIEIFKRTHGGETKELETKNPHTIRRLYQESLKPLFQQFVSEHERFSDLFQTTMIDTIGASSAPGADWEKATDAYLAGDHVKNLSKMGLKLTFKGFKGKAATPFNLETTVTATFEEFQYSVRFDNKFSGKLLYAEPISSLERSTQVKKALERFFAQVKDKSLNDPA